MKNVTLIAISVGTLVIFYSIISGSQVKKVDLGEKTSIEFFPKQPSKLPTQSPTIYNSDNNQSYDALHLACASCNNIRLFTADEASFCKC